MSSTDVFECIIMNDKNLFDRVYQFKDDELMFMHTLVEILGELSDDLDIKTSDVDGHHFFFNLNVYGEDYTPLSSDLNRKLGCGGE